MFVPVKYNNLVKFIECDDDNFDEKSFIKSALDAFEIKNRKNRSMKFIAQNGAVLPPHQFKQIVFQYKSCAFFVVQMVFTDESESINVYNERLKEHIAKLEGDNSLFEEEEQLGFLTGKSRNSLFKHIIKYITTNYTVHAKPKEIEKVCLATVDIFRSLKTTNELSGGIDILYDATKRTGIIYEKLIYERRLQRKQKNNPRETSEEGTSSEIGNAVNSTGAAESTQDPDVRDQENSDIIPETYDSKPLTDFFQTIILPRDESKIKQKLNETVHIRRELDLNNVDVIFDLFLVLPRLILFDFKNSFPEVNSDALVITWTTLKARAMMICQKQFNSQLSVYKKNNQIYALVKMLAIFTTNRKRFDTSLKAMLTICQDVNQDPMHLMENTSSPRMIAIFSEEGDEWKYYIEAKRHLFSIPPGTDFVNVFDYFYKIHHVFNLPFHGNFEQLMVFFDHFVYGICRSNSSPSSKTRMKAQDMLRE